jgi:glyoxylase-like metal-dependent hydrolase (beta-lactamase superfamily II)
VKSPSLQHLAERVYAVPGDMARTRPWVGVVATREGTVLIDSGNGPLHAEDIHKALREIEAPPVTHILLTHHHWDHVFGSCAFPGAHIVAHELTQHHLRIMADEPWSEAYLETKVESMPRGKALVDFMNAAVPDWDDFRVVPATETFATRYEFTLGGYQFEMEHVGGQHEPDQSIVYVRPGNILFLGDATYGRAWTRGWDLETLAATLRGFMGKGAEWYVEGHRSPARPPSFERRIERLLEER